MYLADTLSRAYLPEVHEFTEELERIDHAFTLAITADCLQQIKHISANDSVMKALCDTILHGWPDTKSDVLEYIHPYFVF